MLRIIQYPSQKKKNADFLFILSTNLLLCALLVSRVLSEDC